MSAIRRAIAGVVGSATGSAGLRSTGCPMRAIFSNAMSSRSAFSQCRTCIRYRQAFPPTGHYVRHGLSASIGLNWRESESAAVQVIVRDNNVDQALKALKKKMQREGIFREMKLRRAYEKPSERRAREKAEAVRRARKLERKRLEREGF
jgi:small subunit ribosomal protein S21